MSSVLNTTGSTWVSLRWQLWAIKSVVKSGLPPVFRSTTGRLRISSLRGNDHFKPPQHELTDVGVVSFSGRLIHKQRKMDC